MPNTATSYPPPLTRAKVGAQIIDFHGGRAAQLARRRRACRGRCLATTAVFIAGDLQLSPDSLDECRFRQRRARKRASRQS